MSDEQIKQNNHQHGAVPDDNLTDVAGQQASTEQDTATGEAEADIAETVEGEVLDADAPEAETAAAEGAAVAADTAADITELRQRLEAAEAQVAEHKDQWLRSVAEFKNYKRRTETERADMIKKAGSSVLLKLLPIIDDFERAADSVPEEIASHSWWSGTQLIGQKLRTLLESEGVKPIEALGEDFDPNFHEAVMYEEAEGQDGKVTAELQKGYRLHDHVLRPAMVKVGKG
jgi:molecular chaperone GrpE